MNARQGVRISFVVVLFWLVWSLIAYDGVRRAKTTEANVPTRRMAGAWSDDLDCWSYHDDSFVGFFLLVCSLLLLYSLQRIYVHFTLSFLWTNADAKCSSNRADDGDKCFVCTAANWIDRYLSEHRRIKSEHMEQFQSVILKFGLMILVSIKPNSSTISSTQYSVLYI